MAHLHFLNSFFPQEIASHPDILEVAVVARPHTTWGERPSAFVILKSESLDKWTGKHEDFGSDLKGWLRGKLPGFAIPEWVDVVQDLPVSYIHKLGESIFLICF